MLIFWGEFCIFLLWNFVSYQILQHTNSQQTSFQRHFLANKFNPLTDGAAIDTVASGVNVK